MPLTDFTALPDSARVWVYGLTDSVPDELRDTMLRRVSEYLERWKAHGSPLTSSFNWTHDHFLTIAVDQSKAGASGCSIDELFRLLRQMEQESGRQIITTGLVFFRARNGGIRGVTREEFSALAAAGEIHSDTEVFDLSVTTLREWRGRFASRARDSWHAGLLRDRITT